MEGIRNSENTLFVKYPISGFVFALLFKLYLESGYA